MVDRPRKLSSVEETRHTALETVKRTWVDINQLLSPLAATTATATTENTTTNPAAERRRSDSIVPQIVLDLMSQQVLDRLNSRFDQIIGALAAAVARIQLRNSPSPTEETAAIEEAGMSWVASTGQVILLEDDVLEYIIKENVLLRTLGYSAIPCCPGQASLMLRWNLLRFYETLVSSCLKDPRLLSHEAILVPLLGLFDVCMGSRNVTTDRKMMAVMNELTYCLKQAPDLLPLFVEVEPQTEESSVRQIRDLRILSYLYPHLHNSSETGQLARSAALAIMRVIQNDEDLNQHVAEKSDFCIILVNGLCAFYLSLPHKCFSSFNPGWHRIDAFDVTSSLDLQHFTEYVEFCNAVMKLSHPLVQEQFTKRFRQLFLLPVVTQALTEFSTEEVMAATAYFDYVLRTLDDNRLRACVFDFLVNTMTRAGDRSIMDHLIGNILNLSTRLATVTVAFFHTLLDMNYEPLLDHLVLRFLNEAISISGSVTTDPFDDLALAQELLHLIPACCEDLDDIVDSMAKPREVSSSPNAFVKFFGQKPTDALAATGDPAAMPLFMPTNSDYLLSARCNLKACWEACSKARQDNGVPLHLKNTLTAESLGIFPDLERYGVQFLGPFVASLLFRLDHSLGDQNIYLSFQLTGLISRLLLYPHPPIWTYLFSTTTTDNESGRFLLHILSTLKIAVDSILPKSNFATLVMKRAYRSLLLRTVKPDSPTNEHAPNQPSADRSNKISNFFSGKKAPTESTDEALVTQMFSEPDPVILEGVEFSSVESPRYRRGSAISVNTANFDPRIRPTAYCAVVLCEFVQELAAICQERVILTLQSRC